MRQKAEYKTSIESKEKLKNSFIDLVLEMPFDKITVTKIVEKAGVNRGTFYAHYADIYDLMQCVATENFNELMKILEEFEKNDKLTEPKNMLLKLNEYIIEKEVLYKRLINTNIANIVIEKLEDRFNTYMLNVGAINDDVKESADFIIHSNFFVGGIVKVYKSYLKGELGCSIDDIPEYLNKIILNASIVF